MSYDGEPFDFEEPRLELQGFIVDYVQYRAGMDGLEWYEAPELPFGEQPEHKAMRSLCQIFERRHVKELDEFAEEMLENDNIVFLRFASVIEQFGQSREEQIQSMSYGRLVGVISFSGYIATKLLAHNRRYSVQQIVLFTSRFIDARIRLTWAEENRSWKSFMLMARAMESKEAAETASRRQSRRWSLLVGAAALVGVGAIIGTRVLSAKYPMPVKIEFLKLLRSEKT